MIKINTTELTVNLRYAPYEKFYQEKCYRTPIIDKYPVFNLRYTAGLKGVRSDTLFYKFVASIDKRFILSLGYTDVTVEGGYILGKVPFPY
ncbi:hypothetical protein CS542_05155 [Pedobacter sp. IW39]|nr:hypothetical protein CS542_05155 [Pedobacter sp. IW39]